MTLDPDELKLVEQALFNDTNRLANLCCDSAQRGFRLPSGRKPTQDEIRELWARKDAMLKLWRKVAGK